MILFHFQVFFIFIKLAITNVLNKGFFFFFFFFLKERLSPWVRSGIHRRVAPGGALPASRVEGVIWRGVGGVPRGGERGGEWGGPEVKCRDRDWKG